MAPRVAYGSTERLQIAPYHPVGVYEPSPAYALMPSVLWNREFLPNDWPWRRADRPCTSPRMNRNFRRRLAPGDEHSRRLAAGGPLPSSPPKRQNRSSRPPHESPAFRTRLSPWARRPVGRLPQQHRPPSAQQSLSEDEHRKSTFGCAGKKIRLAISHLLIEASGDTWATGRAQIQAS
jgi:hypothetical protein